MATAAGLSSGPIGLGRRVVEWGVLFAVLVTLLVAFLQKSLEVQAQAEVAAVRTTLAALRTAITLQYIQSKAQPGDFVVRSQRNPFTLLQQVPATYQGELGVAQAGVGSPGWYFDPECICILYATSEGWFLSGDQAGAVLVFRVVSSDGPAQLIGRELQLLRGQRVD